MYDNEPENEEYDDDEYKNFPDGGQYNNYNEYGYPQEFKFDWASWELWLKDALKDIEEHNNNVWFFGGHKQNKSNTSKNFSADQSAWKDKYFMYLGSNVYDEAIWKTKFFIKESLDIDYKNHIASHPAHFLKQPHYYKGMFDILN
jgi:hypothetical protein